MLSISLSLMAALGFGVTQIFARLGLQHMQATPGTLLSLSLSTVVTLVIALALHPHEVFDLEWITLLWLLLVGVLSFPLGRLLNFTGVRMAGVSRASPIVGAAPLFAGALAVGFLGESLNVPILLGTLSIIGGLALIMSQE